MFSYTVVHFTIETSTLFKNSTTNQQCDSNLQCKQYVKELYFFSTELSEHFLLLLVGSRANSIGLL